MRKNSETEHVDGSSVSQTMISSDEMTDDFGGTNYHNEGARLDNS